MVKLTENQKKGLELLALVNAISEETSVCTKYLITEKATDVIEKGLDTKKVNQVNAIEASLVTKELVNKKPRQYGDKMLTHYWLNEKGQSYLNNEEE